MTVLRKFIRMVIVHCTWYIVNELSSFYLHFHFFFNYTLTTIKKDISISPQMYEN